MKKYGILICLVLVTCNRDLGIETVVWPCISDSECAWGWKCISGFCRPNDWQPDIKPEEESEAIISEEVTEEVIMDFGQEEVRQEDLLQPEEATKDVSDIYEVGLEVSEEVVSDEGQEVLPDIADIFVDLPETCIPDCTGRVCGSDGCGGSCGQCPANNECTTEGQCKPICVPLCDGHECASDDGCGGVCGSGICSLYNAECIRGVCVCWPDCRGQECDGDNGCNGTCGTCGPGLDCIGAACVAYEVDLNGYITDKKTGLIWDNKVVHNISYPAAEATCKSPWRVPSIDELRTLVVGCPSQRIFGACPISDTCAQNCSLVDCYPCGSGLGPVGGCYIASEFKDSCQRLWSSSVAEVDLALIPTKRWVLNFKTGEIAGYSLFAGQIAVRCVRSP